MYRSPISLAGFTGIPADKKELQLARKKMLAELELSGDATILINGKELGRQDINALFDELADDERREMHEEIFQRPALLHFLETGEINGTASLAYDGISPPYKPYLSPLVGQAIHAFLQQALRDETDAVYYYGVCNLAKDLMSADADFAFQPAFRYYTIRSRTLEEILEKEKGAMPVSLKEGIGWMSANRVALLNALPNSFSDLRYKIARDLNNISVALEINHKVRKAYEVIQEAAVIQTTAELMELIRENVSVFRRLADQPRLNVRTTATEPKHKRQQKVFYVIGILAIVFILAANFYYAAKRQKQSNTAAPESELFYPMDDDQQFNNHAFIALKKGLISQPSTDTPKISPIYARVYLPCDTCGDGFVAVWKTFFNYKKYRLTDTGHAAQLLLTNKLKDMDAFVLINIDSRYFTSIYLTPGQTKPFLYKGDNSIGVSFYIGSNWNSEAWHEALMPHAADAPDRSCIIQGSFMNVPDEHDYLNPQYDVFSRTAIRNKAYHDTIEISSGKDRKIELLLGLDERDL